MALLTIADVKPYLRIETNYTDEDNLITDLLLFSKTYLENAGVIATDNAVYRLAQKIIIDDRYNHRGSIGVSVKANNALIPLITQLQRSETITTNITPAVEVETDEES